MTTDSTHANDVQNQTKHTRAMRLMGVLLALLMLAATVGNTYAQSEQHAPNKEGPMA